MNFDWNEHYKKGGMSGDPNEYKLSRDWKKNIINKYCDLSKDDIIDIGCGDLQFWDGNLPKYYTGVDISPIIIQKNQNTYPESIFIVSSATNKLDISSNIVCCFDMLWHIIDDNDYINILKNIKNYSKRYIIIYTWNSNVFDKGILYRLFTNLVNFKHGKGFSFNQIDNDGGYQKYRDFLSIVLPIFEPEFKLINTYNNTHWKEGTMYIFEKV
jgi:2-polyprenyl-3-methyl-5-hydroxy-6-metoxy-1,4-benzoquinol methylase